MLRILGVVDDSQGSTQRAAWCIPGGG